MLKSGLIVGVITLVAAVLFTAGLSPLCTPCAVLFLGALAGYLAGVFDKPVTNDASTKAGALAGVIAGIGATIGQLIGTAINGYVVGPEGAARLINSFGLPTGQTDIGSTYWISLVGSGLCLSALDVLIMAGFGALGAMLWWQMSGKNRSVPPAPSATPPLS